MNKLGTWLTYEVLARVNKDGELWGYKVRASSNQSPVYVERQEFIETAKAGRIRNCKVVGGELTGTNGFKLRNLPTESMDKSIKVVAKLYLGNTLVPVGYIFENSTDRTIRYNHKSIQKGCVFVVSTHDISCFSNALIGYELVRNVTYKAVGTFEIIPEIGLRPRIDKISITVYNPTTDTYFVRLPYLYNQEFKEYADMMARSMHIKLIMNTIRTDIVYEESLLARELALFDTSMTLFRNNIYDAMEDNNYQEETDLLDDIDRDKDEYDTSNIFGDTEETGIKGLLNSIGNIMHKYSGKAKSNK